MFNPSLPDEISVVGYCGGSHCQEGRSKVSLAASPWYRDLGSGLPLLVFFQPFGAPIAFKAPFLLWRAPPQ